MVSLRQLSYLLRFHCGQWAFGKKVCEPHVTDRHHRPKKICTHAEVIMYNIWPYRFWYIFTSKLVPLWVWLFCLHYGQWRDVHKTSCVMCDSPIGLEVSNINIGMYGWRWPHAKFQGILSTNKTMPSSDQRLRIRLRQVCTTACLNNSYIMSCFNYHHHGVFKKFG